MRRTSLVLALGLVATGCTKPRTELVIGIMTDLSASDMIDQVTLTAEREGVPLFMQTWTISGMLSVPEELPGSFGVYASDGSEPRITITASALSGANTKVPVVSRTTVTSLVHEQTLFLRMALVSGCSAMSCPAGSTCIEGVCKAQQVNPLVFPAYQKDMEKTLECDSGPKYRDTSTKQLMAIVGKGDCAADEDCQEGTCYKRLGAPATGGNDLGLVAAADLGQPASCDPVAQTGCPAGQKCYVTTAGTFLCKATGTKVIGEACSAGVMDDCAAGLHCAADGTPAVCRQYCNGDGDCTQVPASAAGMSEPTNVARCFEGLTASSVKLCSISCDPIAAGAGCATGRDCGFFTNMANDEYTDCYVSGGITDGNMCQSVGDCAAGETCAQSTGGLAHCRPTCRPGNAGDCPAPSQCPLLPGVANPMFSACCPQAGC